MAPSTLTPAAGRIRRFSFVRTVGALILREMTTRYGRTPGGYVWAVMEPLGAILFLSLGFSLVMRSPSLGNSFLLFYATGYLPFNLYLQVANKGERALQFSRPLLKYPAVTWLDAILARCILNSLTAVLTAVILLAGILAVIDSRTILLLPVALHSATMAIALGLGIGTLNCALSGLFPVWSILWAVLNRPLFLASGILLLYDELPPIAQSVLWYNPLMHVTGWMRAAFFPTYPAAYTSTVYVLAVSLICFTLGLILMGRYHRDILARP